MFGWNGELADVAAETAFVAAFSNVAAFNTDAGLLLADTSSWFACASVHDASWTGGTSVSTPPCSPMATSTTCSP